MGQFTGVEMQPKFSPTWGKNFMDVATAEEFYHWLQSAFLHTVFSPNTFDGPVRREDVPVGYTMTYGVPGEVPTELLAEILSDRPLCVICQRGRWPALAHRVVLEIAMAMIGGAGSATAILIAFSLESILSRACLVDRRGLLVRPRRARVGFH